MFKLLYKNAFKFILIRTGFKCTFCTRTCTQHNVHHVQGVRHEREKVFSSFVARVSLLTSFCHRYSCFSYLHFLETLVSPQKYSLILSRRLVLSRNVKIHSGPTWRSPQSTSPWGCEGFPGMRLQRTVWQTTVEITSCTQELTWPAQSCNIRKKIFTKNVAILQETAYRFESSGELTVIIWKQGRKGSLSVCLRVWRQCLHVSDWNPSTTWSRNLRCRMKLLMFVLFFSVRKQEEGYSTKFCRHQSTGPWQDHKRCDLKGWTSGQGKAVCVCVHSVEMNDFLVLKLTARP